MLDIVDIKAVCDLAHKAGAKVVLDNAFATPMLQRPLEWGADIVVHSATKYIDGQGRTLGGAILGSKEFILEKLQPIIRNTGPSISPFNAWVLVKGMETLGLRIDRHCANAARVADALAAHPAIARVLYPGRSDHPQHKLAMKQMSGAGGVVTFDLKAGKWAAFETLNRLKLIDISNNLGDAKSLVTHPATTTHMRIGAEERAKLGINDGTVRISVGLEDVEDIIADLVQALRRLKASRRCRWHRPCGRPTPTWPSASWPTASCAGWATGRCRSTASRATWRRTPISSRPSRALMPSAWPTARRARTSRLLPT